MSLSKNLEKNSDKEYYVKNILVKIFNLGFFSVFYYLLILAVGKMNMQSPLSSLIILPFYVLILLFMKQRKINLYNIRKWYLLQGISSLLMMLMVYWLDVKIGWDWGQLLTTAYNYNITGTIDKPEYFMRYPNNQFWLVCLIGLFKVVKAFTMSEDFRIYKAVSIVVSAFVVQAAIYFIYRTAKLMWDEKRAFLVGIISLIYVPFYLYALFLYNDTTGAFFAILLMYFNIKLHKEKNEMKRYCIIVSIGILGAMVLHIKLLVFIVFLAIIIEILLLNRLKVLLVTMGIIFLSFSSTHMILEVMVQTVLEFDDEEASKWEFPPTHWIMMALNSYGGYSEEDYVFTRDFDTYEEKKEQNIIKIKERVYNRGFIKLIKHILYTKQLRTWTNSCLAGDDYISRNPLHENSLCQKVFSYNGEWHWVCLIYTWIYHITIMLGILLSAIMSIKMKISEQKLLSGKIAIFGLFLFLSIWECNSRYVFSMAPVMILIAADGIFMTLNWIEHKKGILCNEKVC